MTTIDNDHSGELGAVRPPVLGGPRGLGTELAGIFSAARSGVTPPPPEPDAASRCSAAAGRGSVATAVPNPARLAERLGESAFRLPVRRLTDAEPYREHEWGDGSAPPVYCPPAARGDDALAEAVDDRLAVWAESIGYTDDELDKLRETGYGRLVMLTHTDTDDPDRLLVAAQMNTAWWMADDYYADDSALGADPNRLPQRLTMAMAALDPLPDAGEFSTPLDEALRTDKVLRAFGSAVAHLRRHATAEQVQRACYATFSMFVSWTAYAAWRHTGENPPAWEYLAARQHDSFYTSMTLIDSVAGYEVPAGLFYDERVRRAAFRAGTACVLVNDLFSVRKDAADENPVCNMVLQIAAERGCSVAEATEITVDLHNRTVREFEAEHRALRAVPSPELQLFLHGVRDWMGGSFEWHNTNPRYR
ncbi:family 2 encapsulin nanocompartment cargo protein terpene cyclase [Nocardia sp. CC227C]|uniref:family 2 encapsulin nanocompartment cargo protein terpene cyclase n=1 Tax=Nocardia sp. CC227C TaxID=3044562 RepID=UPI00278BC7E5|nr:family 2 encapsulin nanocompartment cargo protein terpene cyclase [Nocardia sp. CC227C]